MCVCVYVRGRGSVHVTSVSSSDQKRTSDPLESLCNTQGVLEAKLESSIRTELVPICLIVSLDSDQQNFKSYSIASADQFEHHCHPSSIKS